MKHHSSIVIALLSTTFAACTPQQTASDLSQNPLYVEWYNQDIVEQIVSLELNDDPSLKDPEAKELADAARKDALSKSKAAEAEQLTGLMGAFSEVAEPTDGEALLLDDALHLGPDFLSTPGVDLRIYVSSAVDPRDAAFPADADIDLGPLMSPYGPQTYRFPTPSQDIRTVVLWDAALKRIHAFAQMQKAR